jgi:hypothetical protein
VQAKLGSKDNQNHTLLLAAAAGPVQAGTSFLLHLGLITLLLLLLAVVVVLLRLLMCRCRVLIPLLLPNHAAPTAAAPAAAGGGAPLQHLSRVLSPTCQQLHLLLCKPPGRQAQRVMVGGATQHLNI